MTQPFFTILVTDAYGLTISGITPDVISSRRYKYGATVTDYPIEEGASVTDHRKKSPDEIEVEGMFSGSPISSVETTPTGLRGDGPSQSLGSAPIPMQEAHDALLDLHDKSTIVDIQTEYRYHQNMVLTNLDIARTKATGLVFDFTATFKQLRIVSTEAAALPASVVKKLRQKKKAAKTAGAAARYVQTSKKNQQSKVSTTEATQAQKDQALLTRAKSTP